MPIAKLHDVSIHYRFDPSDRRPVLVLSNSLGADQTLWSYQLSDFSRYFSVLRYDARGQGASSAPSGFYSIEQMAQDVLALLDALELKKVSFCGISMGGLVGQWLGIHAPARLQKLVLSNTAARIGTTDGWNERIQLVATQGIQAIVPSVLKGWFTEAFHNNHPETVLSMRQVLLSNSTDGYVGGCAAVRDMDLRKAIDAITTPTLVIYGTEDRSTTPDDAGFLLKHITTATSIPLPAAHLSNIETAERFNKAVLNFLLAT